MASFWLVGGFSPTHLENMHVKLEIFPKFRGENSKKCLKPPPSWGFFSDRKYVSIDCRTKKTHWIGIIKFDPISPDWIIYLDSEYTPGTCPRKRDHFKKKAVFQPSFLASRFAQEYLSQTKTETPSEWYILIGRSRWICFSMVHQTIQHQRQKHMSPCLKSENPYHFKMHS